MERALAFHVVNLGSIPCIPYVPKHHQKFFLSSEPEIVPEHCHVCPPKPKRIKSRERYRKKRDRETQGKREKKREKDKERRGELKGGMRLQQEKFGRDRNWLDQSFFPPLFRKQLLSLVT